MALEAFDVVFFYVVDMSSTQMPRMEAETSHQAHPLQQTFPPSVNVTRKPVLEEVAVSSTYIS